MNDNFGLSDLRKNYEQSSLDESMSTELPIEQFKKWLGEAIKRQVMEPNAMTLATVDADGRPSSRPV